MTAYLGIGSNLGNRKALLEQAVALIAEYIGKVIACSSFIETKPCGFDSEHLFLNGVICVDTPLTPHKLLHQTQRIERRMGRLHKTGSHGYSDRPIDIDILLYGNRVIHSPHLTVPHPLMLRRDFVLKPLLDIAPDITLPPTNERIADLVNKKK
jgi:2-amino-4-hydroxy-6-hydroxymethyldihydropteridine diphosphokinase